MGWTPEDQGRGPRLGPPHTCSPWPPPHQAGGDAVEGTRPKAWPERTSFPRLQGRPLEEGPRPRRSHGPERRQATQTAAAHGQVPALLPQYRPCHRRSQGPILCWPLLLRCGPSGALHVWLLCAWPPGLTFMSLIKLEMDG